MHINQQRVAEHQRTLDALTAGAHELEEELRALQAREAEALQARRRPNRALASRAALIAQIDARRDLNAQLAGELQVAHERLQQQVASLGAGRAVEPVAIPLAPFRGALDWPVPGRVDRPLRPARRPLRRSRPSGTASRSPPPKAPPSAPSTPAPCPTPMRSPASATSSSSTTARNTYSLYGYLGSIAVTAGDGGRQRRPSWAGSDRRPAGPAALYFEIRIDGRSVDPVQWLKPR